MSRNANLNDQTIIFKKKLQGSDLHKNKDREGEKQLW